MVNFGHQPAIGGPDRLPVSVGHVAGAALEVGMHLVGAANLKLKRHKGVVHFIQSFGQTVHRCKRGRID